jgi:hypothetical protein
MLRCCLPPLFQPSRLRGSRQAVLLTTLAILLLSHFRLGYQWIKRMLCTFMYAGLLAPALVQLLWYYFVSGKVMRGVPYGKEARNFVDIYLPASKVTPARGYSPRPVHALPYTKAIATMLASLAYHANACVLTRMVPTQNRKAVHNTTLVYIPGGAWIIGYKGWAALFGRLMASLGYVFIAVDHRNFPQGTRPSSSAWSCTHVAGPWTSQ